MDIKEKLRALSDEKYKEFSSSLIPNSKNILGVRLPLLRKLAKDIFKSDHENYLLKNEFEFQEEIMLQGMIIGLMSKDVQKILNEVENFIPKIDNWAVCDTFVSGLKFTKRNQKSVWKFINRYANSKKEYEIRFFYVMCIAYFIDENYIDKILSLTDKFKDDGYYSKMAVAWALSVCMVKFESKTFEYLKNSSLDDWTFNKAIQKMIESYRVSKEVKQKLKKMKRKI